MSDVLFSVWPKYIDKILSGNKTVELRTRQVNILPGTNIWFYATTPRMQIEVKATITNVLIAKPRKIWTLHKDSIAISKSEYDSYVEGRELVTAIQFNNIQKIESPPHLHMIRKEVTNFQPPQFYSRMIKDGKLHSLLESYA